MKIVINILFAVTCLSGMAQGKHSLGLYGSGFNGFRATNSKADFKTNEKASIGNSFGIFSSLELNEKYNLVSNFGIDNWVYKNSSYFSESNPSEFIWQTFSVDISGIFFFNRNKLAPYAGVGLGHHFVLQAKYANALKVEQQLENTHTNFFSASILAGAELSITDVTSIHLHGFFSHSISSFSLQGYSDYPFKYGVQLGVAFYLK
jgi:hypothetical protein